jgi:hypothetical protein
MRKLRGRLTYANVMATIAVFIALGGASYAAIKLPKNSVGTKQLKRQAVTLKKIKASAKAALRGRKGARGEPGSQGPPGQDATSLFASIRDPSDEEPAVIQYGTGVVSVTDGPGTGAGYEVTFARSVTNCIIHVTPGRGDPAGPPAIGFEVPVTVDMEEGTPPETVTVFFEDAGGTHDVSFFISAIC